MERRRMGIREHSYCTCKHFTGQFTTFSHD